MIGRTAEPIPVARVRGLAAMQIPATPADDGSAWPVRSLHLNEGPYAPAPSVLAAIARAAGVLNRYPDHDASALIAALARHTGTDAARLVVGAGSNELLHFSAEISLEPGDEALVPVPGFPTYARAIAQRGGRCVGVPVRPDGVVDIDAMMAAVGARTRLIFVASPHNPTGGMLSQGEISTLIDRLPNHILLHFDEAYYEFGRHAGASEVLPLLERRGGPWITTRSFSKAYSLAGARVGYGITGSAALADAYRKVRVGFGINALALAAAQAALAEQSHVTALLDHTAAERQRLSGALELLGMRVLPSAANFVAAITPGLAGDLAGVLARKRIFVLPAAWPGAGGMLRITIGTRADTGAVVAALREAIGAP